MAGTITHADVRVGQMVRVTDHLYHVVDLRKVWLVGEALEADCADLQTGQAVRARFAAEPDRPLQGRIDHLRLRMDAKTQTQAVVIEVDNGSGSLRPGMFGAMEIEVEVAKEAVFCPADALIESRSGVYVLVQRGEGKYLNQPVKLGMRRDGRVEILDGVFPGDQVVVVGNYLLAAVLGTEHKARVAVDPGVVFVSTHARPDALAQAPTAIHATVELPTERHVFATARAEGRVSRILVEPCQAVRAGQVLAEVDSLPLRALQGELLEVLTRARATGASAARLEGLASQGIAAKRQLWQLQSELQTLRQAAESLKRQLGALGLTAEQIRRLESADLTRPEVPLPIVHALPVRSPVDGWLVGFEVVPGRVVAPEEKLFEIQDLSKVWAKGFVFEQDAAGVRIGQTVQVAFAAYPGWEVPGTVVRIAPTMEAAERVLPIWVEVENRDLRLKEGMLARILPAASAGP
jgi:multidrug efflux pump subunit AcrA (membrane-fusion protein)